MWEVCDGVFFPAKRIFDIGYLKIFDSAFCLDVDDKYITSFNTKPFSISNEKLEMVET